MKTRLAIMVVALSISSSVLADHLVYVSEKKAVCYVSSEQGLIAGHWECSLDTDQCHCVTY